METVATRRNAPPNAQASMLDTSRNQPQRGSGRSTPRSSQWTQKQDQILGSRQSHLLEAEMQMLRPIPRHSSMSTRTISSGQIWDSTNSSESEELLLKCSSQCLPMSIAVQYSGHALTQPMKWFYQLLSQLGSKLWQLIRPDHVTRTSQSAGSTTQPMPIVDSAYSTVIHPSSHNSEQSHQYRYTESSS
ncbi:MAG: putative capsid protein [Circoviridae sp.]|nr:MAG: putative capsid protein [Circoviridae sp.]